MERDLIKSNQRFYYDGELHPGKLLKKSGENEINVKKFNAIQIGDRHFLLDPNISSEVFLNLQFRNGQYEYLYKSGDKIIVRDENGTEIMPTEWIEKGVKVMTPDGIGRVETVADNIALVKSAEGLKNYYIKNLKYAEATPDLQQYRKSWQIYEQILPQIQQEIKNDNTQLLKGAFMDAFNELDAKMPKKVKEPVVEPVETPKVEPVKVAPQDATPKVSLVSKIKNAFKKPKDIPAPPTVNEPAVNPPTVNVNHDLAVPPPPAPKATSLDHLGKNYIHVDESNRAGQDNHVLTHIGLNPDTTNDNDKYLYHYEVGSHRDPIATTDYLNPRGEKEDSPVKGGIYVPGEEVINKTNGEKNTVVSHIDFNKDTGALNPVNMLVKDSSGQTKSVPRGDLKLASHDRTKHSIVNTDNGNKHLHNVKEGDIINHKGDKHSVIYSDPQKGLATVNQRSGQMHFTSVNNYHKPYLGQIKPEAKEGQTVQIGKQKYTIEHVSGEEEKGMSILSTTNKLGEKEYFEHPTDKLYDKILKRADLQQYEGDRFDPKAQKNDTEETDPKDYPHADTKDIDSAEDILKLKSTHPNLSDDDVDYLKTGRGLNLGDINKMSPEEVKTILDKRPNTGAKVPDSNPMPETPLPQPVQEQQKKSRLDQITELHDNAFGEHNKTVGKDSVTHRVGIGDLALKAGAGGNEILNKEVPIGKNKTAIIHDIDPVGKKITFRMKGDDPEDRKKYKTRSIENFKTYVQENEKLEPRADADVRSRQVAHENDFQNKVYERVAKHLHEKGLEPSKENIDNELNTSNTGLRQSLEQYHKTYEANHNKEKAKGSIVDHPDHEKLDMDKTLSRVPNIENKVAEAMGNIKDHRADQREALKFGVARDIATEFYKQGKEYNDDPDPKYEADFAKHEKLGGKDEELHNSVREILADIKGRKEHENKVQEQKEKYKQAAEESERLSEEKKKTNKEDFLNNNYRNKSDVTEKSINNEMGLQPSKHKFDVIGNDIVDQMGFENHIVPLSSLTASHIPRPEHINQEEGAEKLPMTPNVSHPDALQGRQGYHSLDNAGNSDRKFTMDIGKTPTIDENGKAKGMRPRLLTNDKTSIDSDTPPIVERKGLAINNGRIVGLQTATPEAKQAYVDELKQNAKKMFPDANEAELHKKIDEMVSKGDLPVHVRVPVHSDGSHLSYEKHEDLTNALAKASNDPNNTKGSRDEEKIISSINALKDTTKAKILSRVPPNTTLRQHIQDTGNAKKMLDDYLGDGALHPEEEKTFYDNNGKINEKGKQFLINSSKELNLDKELKDLADSNGKLGKKFDDFHNRNYEILNNIRTHNKDYDLLPHIKDALRETVTDKDQLPGQEKAFKESPITKGLRYLINAPDKDGHKKINNFGLSPKVNSAANEVAEHFNKENKEYKGDYGEAGKAVQKTIADHLKEGGNDKEFHSAVSQKLKALQDYETHQKESKDALTKYKDYVTNIGKEVEDGLGLGMSADTPQQAKENAFRKYANLYDRQQKNQPKESESKPDIHPAGELIKELQNDDKSVSVENEKPDNAVENKEDNISSEKSVGDINNLPDGRFEVSEPDGGKANFTDESKAKEYSKILKNEEDLNKPKEEKEPFVSEHTEPEMQNTASSVHSQLDNHMDSLEPEHHESLKKDLGEDYRKKMPDVISSYIHKGVDALKKYGEKTKEAIKNVTKKILIGSAIMLSLHGSLNSNQVGAAVTPPTSQAIEQAASNETSIPKELNGLSDYGKNIYKFQKGQGKSFAILDKEHAQIHLIDKNGNHIKTLPTVTGIEKSDNWNTSDPTKDTPKGGSTPYGEYSMKLDKDSAFRLAEKVKTEDGKTLKMYNNLAIHKVYEGDAARRYKALTSEDPNDNRMSWGCVNIDKKEMTNTIYPNFNDESVLYVLPEKDTNVNAPNYRNNKEIRDKLIKEKNVSTEYEKSYWDELRKSFEDPEPSNNSPYPMTLESENVMPKLANTATGQQHLATLKNNGVPEEEIHTTGLHNLLNTDKKIPKTDIQDHLRHNTGKWKKENVVAPQHEQYSLPGSHTNYREVLHTYESPDTKMRKLHIKEYNDKVESHNYPNLVDLNRHLTPEEKAKHGVLFEPRGNVASKKYQETLQGTWDKHLSEARNIARPRISKDIEAYAKMHNIKAEAHSSFQNDGRTFYSPAPVEEPWDGGHYHPEGDANIIYHQRFNNRETPEGKKVTHMEEQQSDIHQAGRQYGYKSDFKDFDPEKATAEVQKNTSEYEKHPDLKSIMENTVGYRGTEDQEMKERVDGEDNHKFSDQEKSDLEKYKEIANKYGVKLNENKAGLRGSFSKEEEDKILEEIMASIDPEHKEKKGQLTRYRNSVPDVPLKGNKWKEHGFKQALMEAVKDNSDYLSWTTGDQQFKRWGSINVNWTPHQSKEGWNVNIKGRHNDSDLSRDYHVNSLEDVKKLPGEAGSKWSEKIWDRIQKQPEGADYEPLRHGMNKEYSEVLPNIAKKHLKKFGIHPEDIELKGAGKQIYQGKEHMHSEISDLIKEIENSDRYSGYVKKLLTNTARDLQSKKIYNQSERPFADAVEEMLEDNSAPDGRIEEVIQMLHPDNRIINGSSTKVHAVKITPELREHIIKNGFSMYKSFDEFEEPLQKSFDKISDLGNGILYNHNNRHREDTDLVPLDELERFKEFDRLKTPSVGDPRENIDEIKQSYKNEGVKEPLILEYYKHNKKALLIEGNHRIIAAKEHGMTHLPVRVVSANREAPPNAIPVSGREPDRYNYIPSTMKPSSIGIKTKLDEPLQKSSKDYPERIHAMRNRRGENISSIAVMNGDKILMGRRRDSDKWTLPGGHAEEGESAEETGIRELEEETGIKAKKLESLGSEQVKNPNAPELMINCFKYETDESTSMRNDPDTEVKKWVWVSTPISEDILDNLHAKKNVTLKLLGLQKWEKSLANQLSTAYNNLIKLLYQ